MDTQTDTCSGEEDCKRFVRLRQSEGNLYEDIFENFLIASDGSVFEGRGFEFEGQHSFDRVTTSYNNQAIGVSFIGNYTETDLSEDQFEGFKYFVQRSINESLIRVDYKLYFREQLVGPNVITKRLQAAVTTWDHWTEGDIACSIFARVKSLLVAPRITIRSEWNAQLPKAIDSKRSLPFDMAVIGHSGNASCTEQVGIFKCLAIRCLQYFLPGRMCGNREANSNR